VLMNVFTGMLMLMADTYRYVNEATFTPKMMFLPIGAIAVSVFLSVRRPLEYQRREKMRQWPRSGSPSWSCCLGPR